MFKLRCLSISGIRLLSIFTFLLFVTTNKCYAWDVPSQVFLCPGAPSVDISVDFPGSYSNVYEWFSDKDCQAKIGEGITYTASASYDQKSIYVRRKGNNSDVREVKVGKLDWVDITQIKQGNDGYLCKGGSVELTPVVAYNGRINNNSFNNNDANTGTLAYEWSYDGSRVGRTEKYNAEKSGTYTFKFSANGCQVEKTVVVAAKKELLRLTGADQICNGGSLVIEVGGMDTYKWAGTVTPVEGNKKVKISTPGDYKVVGSTNIGGCKDSLSFTIEEKEALGVKIDGIYALCPGSTSTTLTALVEGVPNETLTFEWTDEYGNTKSNKANITIEETGTYNVVVSDGNCNGGNTTTILNVNNVGTISVQPEDVIICAGYAKTVTARGDNLVMFKWFDSLGNEVNGKTQDQVELKKEGNYSVKGYTKEGCPSKIQEFPARVVDNPGLIVPDLKPCVGDEPELRAQFADSLNFQWVAPTPNEYLNSKEKTIKISKDGTYKARVTDLTTKCQTNAETTIKFLDLPEITGPDKAEICEGGSTSLSFTTVKNGILTGNPKTYKWKNDKDDKILSADSFLVVSEPGKYYFSADNAYGCTTTKEVTVTTKPKPRVTITKDKDYLCGEGEKATFSASGTDISSYKWIYGNSQQFAKPDFPVSSAGTYRLQVTGNNGCVFDTVVSIETKSKVKIDTVIPNFCKGESGKIIVTSSKESDYEWSDGTKSNTLEVTESGNYTVKVTDHEFHCSQNVTVPVVVHENPTISLDPGKISFCKGKSVTLTVRVTNPAIGKYTIAWDNSTSTSSSILVNKAGTYQVTVTDSKFQCKATATAEVTEKALPVVALTSDPDTVCKGESVTLTATGADSYTWERNGVKLNTQKATYSENPQITLEFTIVGKDNTTGCESEPVSKTVVVTNPFTINIAGEPSICEGQVFEALTASGADRFEWYDGENKVALTANYTPTKAGKFTVKGFKSNNICEASKEIETKIESYLQIEAPKDTFFCDGETITVEANGANSYEWTVPSGNIQNAQNLTISESGKYKVTGISRTGCKSLPVDFNVEKKEIPTVTIEGKDVMCSGKNSTMKAVGNGGSTPYTYKWSGEMEFSTDNLIDIEQGGTYKVIVKDKFGCSADASKTVTVASPKVSIEGKDQFCTDSTLTLTAKGDAKKYFWNFSTENKTTFTTGEPGTITLVGEDENGCMATATLNVSKRAIPVLSGDKVMYYCENSSTKLSVTLDSIASGYEWDSNGKTTDNTIVANTEKIYTVVGYDKWNCPSRPFTIDVKETKIPVVSITGDGTVCKYGDPITLTVNIEGNYNEINWSTNETTEQISVKEGGKYTVTAQVGECVSKPASKDVELIENAQIKIEGPEQMCTDSTIELKGVVVKGKTVSFYWDEEATSSDSKKISEGGLYRIKAVDSYGCISRDSFNVNKRAIPELKVKDTTYYCEHSSIDLVANMDSVAKGYVWNNASLTNKNTYNVNSEQTVKVIGYDMWNCPSKPRDMVVKETKVPVIVIEGDTTACLYGDSIVLSVAVKEGNPEDIIWNNGKRGKTINVKDGEFSAYATVSVCKSLEVSHKVDLITNAKIDIKGVDEICTDSFAVLTASSTEHLNYVWEGHTTNKDTVNVRQTGTYRVEGTDKYGCKSKAEKTVNQRDIPQLTITPTAAFCENDSIKLVATLNREACYYVWDKGALQPKNYKYANQVRDYTVMAYDNIMCPSNTATVAVTETKIPVVKIEGPTYVCQNGDPITLTAQVEGAHNRYEWNTQETTESISVQYGGQYIAKAFVGVCSSEPDTFDVEYKLIPKLSIKEGAKTTYCDLLSVTLHAESPTAVSYRWEPEGVATPENEVNTEGFHTVFVEDKFGCKNQDSIETEVIYGPEINIKGDTTLCEFSITEIQLDCPDCVSQTWSTGEKTTSITVYESGYYQVEGIGPNGCPSRAEHHLNVTPAPSLEIEGETEITSNDSTTLTAIAEGSEPFRFYWTPTHEMSQSIIVHSEDIDQWQNYTAMVYDKNNCYNFQTVLVSKHSVKLNGKKNFCEGDSTVITAVGEGVTGFVWSTGETTPSITIKDAGLYSIISTHENGLIDTLKFEIIVHPLPEVNIEGDLSFCRGDSTFLIAEGDAKSYIWDNGVQSDTIIVREEGEYAVSAISKYGCISRDSVNVIVYELPDVQIAGPDTVLEESSIILKAEGAISYHWEKPDTISETIEVFEGGRYKTIGTDEHNCRNIAIHDVRTIPIPHPLINDTTNGHAIACIDDKVALIASGAETYLWDTGETNDTIYVTESRIYTVTGCLSNGQCRENHYSVEFSPHPKMMKIEGTTKICADSFSVLTAYSFNDTLISHFVWSTGEETQSVKVSDTSEYSVSAVSKYGCLSDTISVSLSYYPYPEPFITGITEVCKDSETRLKANGGERYLWIETGEDAEFISVSTPGKQMLRAWNEFGCAADTFIYVEDKGVPVISIRGKEGVCEGYSTTLTAEGIQFKENYYLWNTGDTTSSIVVDKAGDYNVVITNRSGCVATDTIQFVVYPNPVIEIDGSDFVCIDDSTLLKSKQISGNKIDKYSWNTGETDSVEYVRTAGEYTLQVIDIHECYSNIATHETQMRVPNPIAVTGDFDICDEQKDTAIVKAYSVGAAFYSWLQNSDTLVYGNPEFSANRKGMYRVVSTDSFGCRSYKDVEIIGHNAPLVKITGAEIPVCGPETAELSSASESDVIKFLWNTGEITAEIISDHSGDFWLRGTDIYGCIATDTVHLILNDIPDMKIEGKLGFCPNDETDIKVVGAENYIWSNGSIGEHTSFHAAGDYSVKGTDKYGCVKEINFHVNEYFVPEVMLVESPTKISRIDPTVNFSAVSFDDLSNAYFIWSMGDDETVEEKSFDYAFDISKQRWFKVVMAVHTTDGCTYNREVVLPVDLYIPNTITPNGDGINDVFMKGFEVEIFDRHGERLFYGHDGWNGHLKDDSIVADTYYYVLTDITGDIYRGYITVKK